MLRVRDGDDLARLAASLMVRLGQGAASARYRSCQICTFSLHDEGR